MNGFRRNDYFRSVQLRATMREKYILEINKLAEGRNKFVFLISYDMEEVIILREEHFGENFLFFESPIFSYDPLPKLDINPTIESVKTQKSHYQKQVNRAIDYILNGHSYLLNFTSQTPIRIEHSLEEIFQMSSSMFRVYLRDRFVSFSPERFVQICDDRIYSYPMKGTIDAAIPEAESIILENLKERTEHNTIVDLIRNDLSIIADDVKVDRYRYITEVQSAQRKLLQVSSQISGQLSPDWRSQLGYIIASLLPAGSISGAPKKRTLEIISELENYNRGFYTGIMGFYDGEVLDSTVLIRFVESTNSAFEYLYKSGGGITALSNANEEYLEFLNKIYVPTF